MSKLNSCRECDSKIKKDSEFTVESEVYCDVCYNEKFTSCSECENVIDKKDELNFEGTIYCEDCYNDNFGYCDDCETTVKSDDLNNIDSRYICSDCLSNNYTDCSNCDVTVNNDDSYYCDNCSADYCRDCFEDEHNHEDGSDELRDATINFPDSEQGKLIKFDNFVGVEFESENGSFNGLYNDIPRDCGIEHDGSLDNGIEVQTPPRKGLALENMIDSVTSVLNDHGFEPTTKAGLHVHIDIRDIKDNPRKLSRLFKTLFVSEDILFSMLPPSRWQNTYCNPLSKTYGFDDFKAKIFEQVDTTMADLTCDRIHLISETEPEPLDEFGHYAWCYNYPASARTWCKKQKLDIDYIKKNPTRYMAVNVQAMFEHGTIEFRHHASTLNPIKVKNWIKLLLTLVNYSQTRYNDKEIIGLLRTPFTPTKLEKFYNVFKIDRNLQSYINSRIAKFNPSYKAILTLPFEAESEDN